MNFCPLDCVFLKKKILKDEDGTCETYYCSTLGIVSSGRADNGDLMALQVCNGQKYRKKKSGESE